MVEKALVCYEGDGSRILDVCRARLIFPDARAAAACLRSIAAEADAAAAAAGGGGGGMPAGDGVAVVRVRNGVDAAFDDDSSAGFRVRPTKLLRLSEFRT
jgi:hypothetical protein